jgi:hypothetical protein
MPLPHSSRQGVESFPRSRVAPDIGDESLLPVSNAQDGSFLLLLLFGRSSSMILCDELTGIASTLMACSASTMPGATGPTSTDTAPLIRTRPSLHYVSLPDGLCAIHMANPNRTHHLTLLHLPPLSEHRARH